MLASSLPQPLRLATLSLLATLALAAAWLGSPAERAEAAKPLPGMETGVSYVYGNDPIDFQHVVEAGGKWALSPLRWGEIAPAKLPASWNAENPADPNYDWHFFDVWVSHAVQAGLTPVFQVRGAPRWAQDCPTPFPVDAPCKPDPKELAAFARAAALRYSGNFPGLPKVSYWQALNEPNLSLFFNPQYEGDKAVSPDLYRVLLNSFYAALKSIDPSNKVIAGGLGPIAVPGYTIGPMNFTRRLLCMTGRQNPRPLPGDCEGGVHFDIFDIHPYTTGGPTHEGGPDDVQLGDIPKLTALLAAADRAGRIKNDSKQKTPLWATELSWDSNPPDPGGLQMKILSQWTAEALYRSWKAGVHKLFWYSLVDFDPNPPVPADILQSGLYFFAPNPADQQPKEVMYAFRFPFVAFPRENGLLVWGRTPTSRGGRVVIQVRQGGKWRGIGRLRANGRGMFSTVLDSGYGGNKKGAVRALFRGEGSLAFPMNPVGDFPQPPFGS